MILVWLIIVPLAGGILAWLAERFNSTWPRWIALACLAADLGLVLHLWVHAPTNLALTGTGRWIDQLIVPWIPRFGISFHLAVDGLSLLLLVLTVFLGGSAVVASWTEIRERQGFFYFSLLWTVAGVIGVFLALDLFLFFVFWEVMLVPMYFLIAVWGHENRLYAAIKFFIFTQASGLLMLVSIIALVLVHHAATGIYSFDYMDLLYQTLNPRIAIWVMLGFFVAFAVKLPAFPFHPWLPDAHTEAPTAGSVLLASLLLKTGAYGLIRFIHPLFPEAAAQFAPIAMLLGAIGVLYGAAMAYAQDDFKRLVAYTSVSHMGFIMLGVFAWNTLALQGVVMIMLAHGVTTGALFIISGSLQERLQTRDMNRMGGLWQRMPRMGSVALFFAIATVGLPGLGNFVGEFLTLLGSFRVNVPLTATAAVGMVVSAIYALLLIQRAFQGAERKPQHTLVDFGRRELAMMTALMLSIGWLGLYPQTVFNLSRPALQSLQYRHTAARRPSPPTSPLVEAAATHPEAGP